MIIRHSTSIAWIRRTDPAHDLERHTPDVARVVCVSLCLEYTEYMIPRIAQGSGKQVMNDGLMIASPTSRREASENVAYRSQFQNSNHYTPFTGARVSRFRPAYPLASNSAAMLPHGGIRCGKFRRNWQSLRQSVSLYL